MTVVLALRTPPPLPTLNTFLTLPWFRFASWRLNGPLYASGFPPPLESLLFFPFLPPPQLEGSELTRPLSLQAFNSPFWVWSNARRLTPRYEVLYFLSHRFLEQPLPSKSPPPYSPPPFPNLPQCFPKLYLPRSQACGTFCPCPPPPSSSL